jgi:hypothetical protein
MDDIIKYALLFIAALLAIAVLGLGWGVAHALINRFRQPSISIDKALAQKQQTPVLPEPVNQTALLDALNTPAAQEGADKYMRE